MLEELLLTYKDLFAFIVQFLLSFIFTACFTCIFSCFFCTCLFLVLVEPSLEISFNTALKTSTNFLSYEEKAKGDQNIEQCLMKILSKKMLDKDVALNGDFYSKQDGYYI